MKKVMCFIVFTFCCFVYGSNNRISDIKTLIFHVSERKNENKQKLLFEYNAKILFPEKIKKEMTYPELNKGEITIIDKDKKIIYLPLFDQLNNSKATSEDFLIFNIIKYLQRSDKTSKSFRDLYYNNKFAGVKIDKDIFVNFIKYENVDGFVFPVSFVVSKKNKIINEINFSNIKINSELKKEEFVIER